MKNLKFLSVLICLVVSVSNAKQAETKESAPKKDSPKVEKTTKRKVSSNWCEAKPLLLSAKSLEDFKIDFDQKDRGLLIQGLWYEILSPRTRVEVLPLIQYLAYTEQNSSVSGYYQALAMLLDVPGNLDEAMSRYPNLTVKHPGKVKLKDLCHLYDLAGGKDF